MNLCALCRLEETPTPMCISCQFRALVEARERDRHLPAWVTGTLSGVLGALVAYVLIRLVLS